MKISLLCSDAKHPVNKHLKKWASIQKDVYQVELVRRKNKLKGGDILFLISCTEILNANDRSNYRKTLVLHASDLPYGRGWSPHIWQLIKGAEEIILTLFEAEDKLDSGLIWSKVKIPIPKHALWDEINLLLHEAEIKLIDLAIREFNTIHPTAQEPLSKANYFSKRTPSDSIIDPTKTISTEFNKIRVCDPNRYPAYFELHGKKYKIILEKFND